MSNPNMGTLRINKFNIGDKVKYGDSIGTVDYIEVLEDVTYYTVRFDTGGIKVVRVELALEPYYECSSYIKKIKEYYG